MKRWYDSGPEEESLIDDDGEFPVICGSLNYAGHGAVYLDATLTQTMEGEPRELIGAIARKCDPEHLRTDLDELGRTSVAIKQARTLQLLNEPEVKEALEKIPHPVDYLAERDLTLWDYAAYRLINAGQSGMQHALGIIKKETGRTLPRHRRR